MNKLKIAYLGVEGAFSYEAATTLYPNATYFNYESFKSIFKALENKEVDYGVIPIENTSTGIINDNYDFLREYNFYIVKELSLKIKQNLLGIKGANLEDILEIYSHVEAIKQSKEFLDNNHIKANLFNNTATSAKYIKSLNNKNIGAIASLSCAKLYDLAVLKENINSNDCNETRFVSISNNLEYNEDSSTISIIFNLEHKCGTLYNILKIFNDYKLNMTRIESRPIKNKPYEYYFYIDFNGNLNNLKVKEALTKIGNISLNLRILGNY